MCAKEDIDNVSRDRHGAKCGVDHQVPDHSHLQPARCTELSRLKARLQADQGRHGIARDGHEPEYRIKADTAAHARQRDRGVHEARERD